MSRCAEMRRDVSVYVGFDNDRINFSNSERRET